ncbi:MAG: hypothetical protein HC927_04535 [Deltaproteobacteria bacterium]|nr:hypothetical protein [Deltaproteobacteria bacterium]
MIKLDPTERTDTTWIEWRQKCDDAQITFNVAIESHAPDSSKLRPKASRKIYAELKEEHYAANRAPFWGKCAYCELRIRSSQPGDIEHFRPKGRITDEQTGEPIKGRGGYDHPGYYWLAYDWRNLLLSCESCNRPNTRSADGRRIGKWDHFPLADESKRAEAPGGEAEEEPLLINPLVEDPGEHLAVTKEGVLFAVDGSKRGQACIDLLGLNDRDLPDERGRAYEDAYRMYTELLLARLGQNHVRVMELQKQLREILIGSRPHAISTRLAIDDARRAINGM